MFYVDIKRKNWKLFPIFGFKIVDDETFLFWNKKKKNNNYLRIKIDSFVNIYSCRNLKIVSTFSAPKNADTWIIWVFININVNDKCIIWYLFAYLCNFCFHYVCLSSNFVVIAKSSDPYNMKIFPNRCGATRQG